MKLRKLALLCLVVFVSLLNAPVVLAAPVGPSLPVEASSLPSSGGSISADGTIEDALSKLQTGDAVDISSVSGQICGQTGPGFSISFSVANWSEQNATLRTVSSAAAPTGTPIDAFPITYSINCRSMMMTDAVPTLYLSDGEMATGAITFSLPDSSSFSSVQPAIFSSGVPRLGSSVLRLTSAGQARLHLDLSQMVVTVCNAIGGSNNGSPGQPRRPGLLGRALVIISSLPLVGLPADACEAVQHPSLASIGKLALDALPVALMIVAPELIAPELALESGALGAAYAAATVLPEAIDAGAETATAALDSGAATAMGVEASTTVADSAIEASVATTDSGAQATASAVYTEPREVAQAEAQSNFEATVNTTVENGPGKWVPENAKMGDAARDYQSAATGQPPGQAYQVGGVRFDGYADGKLLEAKGPGYGNFVGDDGRFRPGLSVADNLLGQARRQILAAGDTPIEWRVAEKSAADAIRLLFDENELGQISVCWLPVGSTEPLFCGW